MSAKERTMGWEDVVEPLFQTERAISVFDKEYNLEVRVTRRLANSSYRVDVYSRGEYVTGSFTNNMEGVNTFLARMSNLFRMASDEAYTKLT